MSNDDNLQICFWINKTVTRNGLRFGIIPIDISMEMIKRTMKISKNTNFV